jgi:Vacuolar protein sorting-associated protein 26
MNLTPKVTIRVRDGKKTAHDGIKVEFVGSIGSLSISSIFSANSHSFQRAIL